VLGDYASRCKQGIIYGDPWWQIIGLYVSILLISPVFMSTSEHARERRWFEVGTQVHDSGEPFSYERLERMPTVLNRTRKSEHPLVIHNLFIRE